uniref:Uncharacterized protein n=1 Tax=Romanomermis culicivorax TaxID=13658 RepID=A0A915KHK4_ROMCU
MITYAKTCTDFINLSNPSVFSVATVTNNRPFFSQLKEKINDRIIEKLNKIKCRALQKRSAAILDMTSLTTVTQALDNHVHGYEQQSRMETNNCQHFLLPFFCMQQPMIDRDLFVILRKGTGKMEARKEKMTNFVRPVQILQ